MWRSVVWRARGLAVLAAALSFFSANTKALADEAVAPPVIGGHGGLIEPPEGARSQASDETPATGGHAPGIDHRSILLDLDAMRPPVALDSGALVNEIAPECDCPGSVIRTYHGIQGIAVKRLLGYYSRLFSEDMKNRWTGTSESIFQLDRRMERMACAEADMKAGGRWWDRTWRQSLVPEAGGTPALSRIESIGKELEIVRAGEFALTTEGRLRVGRLSLYLDDDRIYQRIEQRTREALFAPTRARADANLTRPLGTEKEKQERPQKQVVSGEDRIDVSLALLEDDAAVELERVLSGTNRGRAHRRSGVFETPQGNVYTGEGWNLAVRPRLQLRLPTAIGDVRSAISQAQLVVEVGLFPGETRQLWGTLSFRVSTSPRDKEFASASIALEVVRW
jgi:hypothetical protein